ncbi:hypothetical protein C0J52_00608 [Blattella germanica]|nr:hypothetical protein C0J52_00608 [Blattella germanica]
MHTLPSKRPGAGQVPDRRLQHRHTERRKRVGGVRREALGAPSSALPRVRAGRGQRECAHQAEGRGHPGPEQGQRHDREGQPPGGQVGDKDKKQSCVRGLKCVLSTGDVLVILICYYKTVDDHLAVDTLTIDMIPSDIEYFLGGFLDGENVLGEAFNQFLNQNSHEVFTALKPPVMKVIGKIVWDVIDEALLKFPLHRVMATA